MIRGSPRNCSLGNWRFQFFKNFDNFSPSWIKTNQVCFFVPETRIYRTSQRVRAQFARQFRGVLVHGFFWNFGYQSFITRQFDSQNLESIFAKLWIFYYGLTFWPKNNTCRKIDPFWLHHLLPIRNFAPPAANLQFCCFLKACTTCCQSRDF